MKATIVVGLGFGDEGKGKVTNYCSKVYPTSLVVRYNGGHQAGHTVVEGGVKHVFSSFGSGTLNGSPTFISKYCTLYPSAMLWEYKDLLGMGVKPVLYVDPLAMVTTPFDVNENRQEEVINAHGSCGAGFGKTIERHETLNDSYRIFAKDLYYDWVLKQKLEMLSQRHGKHSNIDLTKFLDACKACKDIIKLLPFSSVVYPFDNLIFEGAQGIMLDREHGIFPHVTRSSTTCKNALSLLSEINYKDLVHIKYLTRCYQTRHGNGPLYGEDFKFELKNNENETNVTNPWQGEFRKAPLCLDLIDYAIKSDTSYHTLDTTKIIFMSHLDQLDQIPVDVDGHIKLLDKCELVTLIKNKTDIRVTTLNSEEL